MFRSMWLHATTAERLPGEQRFRWVIKNEWKICHFQQCCRWRHTMVLQYCACCCRSSRFYRCDFSCNITPNTNTNRPLAGSQNPHFQNKIKCATFLVKKRFICMRMKIHFHIKDWALNLVFIQWPWGTRKWPIDDACAQKEHCVRQLLLNVSWLNQQYLIRRALLVS